MAKLNQNFARLQQSYLFSDIAHKVEAYAAAHPGKKIIRMGIGDVTLPLPAPVVDALHAAVSEMGVKETFHGYGPEQGYPFLREAIAGYYLKEMGVRLDPSEILVSDGAKSDVGNIVDLFDTDNTVLIPDPVYPVYQDTNVMSGRKILYMNATSENGFLPLPDPKIDADLIYLCSPNNPTGAVYTFDQLSKWVAYARERNAVILFDAAYERFVSDPSLPRSIYQVEGASECAIEFSSLSKTAGFTGLRCGYTVVPFGLKAGGDQNGLSLNKMWVRRQTTKFNGVPYIVQRAAQAVFSAQGLSACDQNIAYYRRNAQVICDLMNQKGIEFYGGVNSPYIWLRCPRGMKSWDFFDLLLNEAAVVGTPGAGFGENGEYFFRLTAFGDKDNTVEAMGRLSNLL